MSRRRRSTCEPSRLIQDLPWLTRGLPCSIASFPPMIARIRRKRAPRRKKLFGYRQPWAKRIWLSVFASIGERRLTTQRLRNSRAPRRLLPITPRSTVTSVASIAGRDAGVNRWQASNALGISILATAYSIYNRTTFTFLCVTGHEQHAVSVD